MRRALGLLLLLALVIGAAWQLRDMGGTVEVRVGDTFIGVSLPVLLLLLLVGFVLLHGLLLALRAIGAWPGRVRARRAARFRDEGDAATTRALVALAGGDAGRARLELRLARQRLGDTPALLVLAGEVERLAGREDAAAEAFRALAALPDARFLGLRGLLRQAIGREDWAAARQLAAEAETARPGAGWLREERASLALRTQAWGEALALGAPDAPKAVLALAAARAEADATKAAELERQAFAADAGFAPAALAHAARLSATGSGRRARLVLEQAWAAAPHPDLATAYLEGAADELARVKSAEALTHRNRAHPESRLLLARTALAASLTGRARGLLNALVESGQADRRAYLLLTELELLEQGESAAGRAAEAKWLRAAAAAPHEPSWRCAACGTAHEAWVPVCEHCGTVGRIDWETQAAPG